MIDACSKRMFLTIPILMIAFVDRAIILENSRVFKDRENLLSHDY